MTNPTCFISYSWDNDEHKKWVLSLATALQDKGVETKFDLWDVKPGIDLTQWVETCIRESDYILLVCTPNFAQKANTGQGGAGYEKSAITGELLYGNASPLKYVPVLRSGDQKTSLPTYLRSKAYLDFRDDHKFESSFDELLRHIYNSPKYTRPPLGSIPNLPTLKVESQTDTVFTQTIQQDLRLTFNDVFQYAIAYQGLRKSRQEAEAFAKMWMKDFYNKSLETFKTVFAYAISYRGLRKSRPEAETFAKQWMNLYYDKSFDIFKEKFQQARSVSGLRKKRPDAEIFALGEL